MPTYALIDVDVSDSLTIFNDSKLVFKMAHEVRKSLQHFHDKWFRDRILRLI